ncbi:hypothetical protein [Streptomyces sp. NBC_00648]|uniref:hypothetical protein n=1 Tax=Streptomyces sp. NBC_00648 TaxID=2975797 RepID=UPI003248E42C
MTRIARTAGVAAAIPVLLLATTGSAHADGFDISWTQRATDHCLMWNETSSNHYSVQNDYWCWNNETQGTRWDDVQGGLEDQTGKYYAEKVHNTNVCLTAFWADPDATTGPVYLENCSSPVNYYEQWEEKWVGNGFHLVNRETGWCLDGNGSGSMYTAPCDPSNKNNKYQIWY